MSSDDDSLQRVLRPSFAVALFVLGAFFGYFGDFFLPGLTFLLLPPAAVVASAVIVIYALDRRRRPAGRLRRRD